MSTTYEHAKRLDELQLLDDRELLEHRLRYKQYTADLDVAIANLDEGSNDRGLRTARLRYQSGLAMINDILTLRRTLSHGENNKRVGELYRAVKNLFATDANNDEAYEAAWYRLEAAVAAMPEPGKVSA